MRLRAAAVALAGLAALVGCGGGDDNDDFKQDYRSASGQIEAIGNDIPAALRGARNKPDAAAAGRLSTLAKRTQAVVRDLRALDPPKDLTDDRDDLARAVAVGADDLRDIATASRAGSARGSRAATRKLIRHSRAIRNARGRLDFLVKTD